MSRPTVILGTIAALLAGASALWFATRAAPVPAASAATPTTPPLASAPATPAVGAPPPAAAGAAPADPARWATVAPGEIVRDDGVLPARYDVPSAAETYSRATPWPAAFATDLRSATVGGELALPLFDGRVLRARVGRVFVEASGQRIVSGELVGDARGTFALGAAADGSGLGGQIFPAAGLAAYVVETGRDGRAWLVERAKPAVVCTEYPQREATAAAAGATDIVAPTDEVTVADVAGAEYLLSSRPAATAVAYLDFDGESVTDPLWNGGATIDASASGLSAAQITEAWRRVAEDFRPFNVDVTTNRARYDAAPVKSRMRCIVTQNSGWYGNAGGVAYVSSWRNAGNSSYSSTIPCWVFSNMLAMSARYVAEAISHEVGHTLGLSHDGVKDAAGNTTASYYTGHAAGATGWAPIMGVGYYQSLVQWSKGEYVPPGGGFANNTEDDLAIITATANNTPYLADDAGATPAEAAGLRFGAANTVDTVGTVERTGDTDVYAFTTAGGALAFTFSREVAGGEGDGLADLDASATLYDSTGAVVASANPGGDLFPNLSASVAAGTYYLAVTGVGQGGASDGYSNYGSLGRYAIGGTVPEAAVAPVLVGAAAVNAPVGTAITYAIQATGRPTSYAASGLPAGVALDSATGVIAGTPTQAGAFAVTVSATNAFGTGARTVTFTITSTLGSIVEAPLLAWSTGGNAAWFTDTATFHDGVSALRSGAIGASGTSWLETTVGGAGSLSFWWRVSSETNADYLRLAVDGVEVTKISGTVAWTQVTQVLAAGPHTVRWSYTKNNKTNSGSDAGWLDGVVWTPVPPAPVITSEPSARCVIGLPFAYRITASNTPTSFGASGLPAGLTLDPVTGWIGGAATTAAARGLTAATISATNAGGTGSASFTVEVVTAFSAWTEDSGLRGADLAATADPDGDGVANLLEYAFARSASVAEAPSQSLPQTVLRTDLAVPALETSFLMPAERPDAIYTVQVSSDLATWASGHAYGPGTANGAGLPTTEVSRTAESGGVRVVVRDTAAAGAAQRFLRVVVSTQP